MPTYNYNNPSYHDRCVLAEKLGDVKLRQWCIEHASVDVGNANKLDFTKADALFKYIKGGKQDAK